MFTPTAFKIYGFQFKSWKRLSSLSHMVWCSSGVFQVLERTKPTKSPWFKSRKDSGTSVERGFPVKSSVQAARVLFFFCWKTALQMSWTGWVYECGIPSLCSEVFSYIFGLVDVGCRERSGILLRSPDRKKPDRLPAKQSARSARIPDRKQMRYYQGLVDWLVLLLIGCLVLLLIGCLVVLLIGYRPIANMAAVSWERGCLVATVGMGRFAHVSFARCGRGDGIFVLISLFWALKMLGDYLGGTFELRRMVDIVLWREQCAKRWRLRSRSVMRFRTLRADKPDFLRLLHRTTCFLSTTIWVHNMCLLSNGVGKFFTP